MRYNWFTNPDNVAYCNVEDFADNFGKELEIPNLRNEIEKYRENPVKEGVTLIGTKRSSVKIFTPNMYFEKEIEMGDSVWLFIGETYPAYCIYWPR